MNKRVLIGLGMGVVCGLAVVWMWRGGGQRAEVGSRRSEVGSQRAEVRGQRAEGGGQGAEVGEERVVRGSSAAVVAGQGVGRKEGEARQGWMKYRLSNTGQSVGELARNPRGILLANALVDTGRGTELKIPAGLRAAGDPGSYIVQARGPVDGAFRAALAAAGAKVISYIPNDAYLVRADAGQVEELRGSGQVGAVMKYEPYYKLQSGLLKLAVEGKPLGAGQELNVVVFGDALEQTERGLKEMGARVLWRSESPFGPVLRVAPGKGSLEAVAGLAGVENVEAASGREASDDLSRAAMGVAADSVTVSNYLDLRGSNVVVAVNDTGVDAGHPDLAGRVFSEYGNALTDGNGHGTHVAGIIGGSGLESETVTNASGSEMPGVTNQFRGMAPEVRMYSLPAVPRGGSGLSDEELEELAVRTNAMISNNSWNYGDNDYDIAAANYDAAVRDAMPGETGSQPLVVVFSAGNGGNGADNGKGGDAGSIQSPGTAKNVITVGALEQARGITNRTQVPVYGTTNVVEQQPWAGETDSGDEVARYSSRGNVGIGVEGDNGRVKPDVVAPGTFVVSDRSRQWDEGAYYNPTNYHYQSFNGEVDTNGPSTYSFLVPGNAVEWRLSVSAQAPVVDLPLYVKANDVPSTNTDYVGDNTVTLDGGTTPALPVGQTLFYSIGNPTNQVVKYGVSLMWVTTNDNGNYFEVLSNLNDGLGTPPHYYRYESGTSMAAAAVSGVAALVEDFYTNRLGEQASPALVKALLINGARPGGQYSLGVGNNPNYEGWGLVNLSNSVPGSLGTNTGPTIRNLLANGPTPELAYDQSAAGALATGQRRTIFITVTNGARTQPLRVTLVWTDPPGNPAAGLKLVNDLDLVVTNLDDPGRPLVYFGNDIEGGNSYNLAWDTNSAPKRDVVNNVENVFLGPELGTNYSVTVIGRRVNVNAVTEQTNEVEQDYALVISSGDGEVADALRVVPGGGVVERPALNLTVMTNSFAAGLARPITGQLLMGQRVGANFELAGTNTVPLGTQTQWGSGGAITAGVSNQWHFYVISNEQAYANAAFVTFDAANLGATRMGTTNTANAAQATRPEADVDLYVSRDGGLTNLDPAVLASADKSVGRGGTELVVYTNAQPGAYYIGVKAEDQEAGEYGLFGVFSQLPFSTTSNGVEIVYGINLPAQIPDGSPALPGVTNVMGIAVQPITIRRVVVTNELEHQNFGDLLGSLTHGGTSVVLNNHSFPPGNAYRYQYVYEDNGENDVVGAKHTDGPGSLTDFMGEQGVGLWMLTEMDTALTHTGAVDSLEIRLDPQSKKGNNGVDLTVQPRSFAYDVVAVPYWATNLSLSVYGNTLPVQLYVKRGSLPTRSDYDYVKDIVPPGDVPPPPVGAGTAWSLNVNLSDLPPLRPGKYYVGIYNPNGVAQDVSLAWEVLPTTPGAVPMAQFSSTGTVPILDDAVSYSTIQVTNEQKIVEAMVGVVIDHPRVSDLVLTLISPSGQRYLLMENRGGSTTNGLGSYSVITNVPPQTKVGDAAAATNTIAPVPTLGTLLVDYNFGAVPNTMDVYYGGADIFSSGPVTGAGQFKVPYGPGGATSLDVVVNQGGNTNNQALWFYTATVVSENVSYFTFTDDTNFAQVPIKFAIPPFSGGTTNVSISGFESAAAGEYLASTNAVVDGWDVISNQVSVVNDPTNAQAGNQYLALASGTIGRDLSTIAPGNYSLSFGYRGPGIVSWWRAEGDATDTVGGNNGALVGGASFAPGEVGQAFSLDGTSNYVVISNAPSLNPTGGFSIEGWIYPTRDTYQAILSKWGDEGIYGNNRSYSFETYPGGALSFAISDLANQGNGPFQAFVSPGGVLTTNAWNHVAATYDSRTGIRCIYVNGVKVATKTNAPVAVYNSITPVTIGVWMRSPSDNWDYFQGRIDELSLYRRTLSASEIQAIFAKGAAGKFDAANPAPLNLAKMQVSAGGTSPLTLFGDNDNWQTAIFNFTATQYGAPLQLEGVEPGMLLDSLSLSNVSHYLPEQSLQPLVGQSAEGTWTLEIRDDRSGANLNAQLVRWQMQFILETNGPASVKLSDGIQSTNSIPACGMAYYSVEVPSWATEATNVLVSASVPVQVWFNQDQRPVGDPAQGDYLLMSGQSGSAVLTTAGTPPLIPGATYYLGVTNACANGTNADVVLRVDFNRPMITLTNAIAYAGSNLGTNVMEDYYRFVVSNGMARGQFEIEQPSGAMELMVRRGSPADVFNYDYLSDNGGTKGELIVVLTNSTPVALSAGEWYLTAVNLSGGPVSYAIKATAWATTGRPITISGAQMSGAGTNSSLCITWSSLPGVHYYIEGVTTLSSTNWEVITPTITATDTNTTYCVALPSVYHFFRVVEGLSPGLAAALVPAPAVGFSWSGSGVVLQWTGPLGAQYQVQWTPSLASGWTTLPGVITSVSHVYVYLDDGSQTGGLDAQRFYRVVVSP